jgi:hypothetical protein
MRVAHEELLGLWASLTADLVSFFRSKCFNVYDKLANALDVMANEDDDPTSSSIPVVASLLGVNTTTQIRHVKDAISHWPAQGPGAHSPMANPIPNPQNIGFG